METQSAVPPARDEGDEGRTVPRYAVLATPVFLAFSVVAFVCTVGLMALVGPGLAQGLFSLVVHGLWLVGLGVVAALPAGVYVERLRAESAAAARSAAKRGAVGPAVYLAVALVGVLFAGPFVWALSSLTVGGCVAAAVSVAHLRR